MNEWVREGVDEWILKGKKSGNHLWFLPQGEKNIWNSQGGTSDALIKSSTDEWTKLVSFAKLPDRGTIYKSYGYASSKMQKWEFKKYTISIASTHQNHTKSFLSWV